MRPEAVSGIVSNLCTDFLNFLFNQKSQFLQQIKVKNLHPVYGAGILARNLQNMSLIL